MAPQSEAVRVVEPRDRDAVPKHLVDSIALAAPTHLDDPTVPAVPRYPAEQAAAAVANCCSPSGLAVRAAAAGPSRWWAQLVLSPKRAAEGLDASPNRCPKGRLLSEPRTLRPYLKPNCLSVRQVLAVAECSSP